jgi:hypothetical protein
MVYESLLDMSWRLYRLLRYWVDGTRVPPWHAKLVKARAEMTWLPPLHESTADENQVLLDMRQTLQVTQIQSWYDIVPFFTWGRGCRILKLSWYDSILFLKQSGGCCTWLLNAQVHTWCRTQVPLWHEVEATNYTSQQLTGHPSRIHVRWRLLITQVHSWYYMSSIWQGSGGCQSRVDSNQVPPWHEAEAADYSSPQLIWHDYLLDMRQRLQITQVQSW